MSGGTSVTITGTDLNGVTAVTFGGVSAAVTPDSSTRIVAVSPAGAVGSVDVLVTTVGGTSANTTADNFTYLPVAPVSQPQLRRLQVTSKPA